MTAHPAARLGGSDLRSERHVCALFEGAADAANAMLPFVIEGLERGERVIHLVRDAKTYFRLLRARAGIQSAVASGQLDVRTWDESYLSGGRFNASRMLRYVRRSLREGPVLGFTATRLIGDMEWADERVRGVDELLTYESGLNAILARPRTIVVCSYDVRRHSGSRIAQIVAAHSAALVNGSLQPVAGSAAATSPRDRIVAAAGVLFAENGTSRTGVDALIDAAGVAKATFYRHFPSKDALVAAWLADPRTRWFDRIRAVAEARATGRTDVISRFFEAVAEWLEADDFVGCPYLNTSIEISDAANPASILIREHLAEIGKYLREQAAAVGHPQPDRVGRELHALLAGSISLAVANRTATYARAARDAAVQLLGMARDPSRA
jgi:AcrR family transcriptional regulator